MRRKNRSKKRKKGCSRVINNKETIQKELWQRAEDALWALYGENPDARILNRFYNEKIIFGDTDAIIVWDRV